MATNLEPALSATSSSSSPPIDFDNICNSENGSSPIESPVGSAPGSSSPCPLSGHPASGRLSPPLPKRNSLTTGASSSSASSSPPGDRGSPIDRQRYQHPMEPFPAAFYQTGMMMPRKRLPMSIPMPMRGGSENDLNRRRSCPSPGSPVFPSPPNQNAFISQEGVPVARVRRLPASGSEGSLPIPIPSASSTVSNQSGHSAATTSNEEASPSPTIGLEEGSTLSCPLIVNVCRWSYNVDSNGKVYVAYHIVVVNGAARWEVTRRYSQFYELHRRLVMRQRMADLRRQAKMGTWGEVAAGSSATTGDHTDVSLGVSGWLDSIPDLPVKKGWFGTSTTDTRAIAERSQGLEKWLCKFVNIPDIFQRLPELQAFLSRFAVSAPDNEHALVLLPAHFPNLPSSSTSTAKPTLMQLGQTTMPLIHQPFVSTLQYPDWVYFDDFWRRTYETDEQKMRLVIEISRRNVSHRTGGPFGAAIFERGTNRLVSVGLSLVAHLTNCTMHAEMVAIQMATALTLAQQQLPSAPPPPTKASEPNSSSSPLPSQTSPLTSNNKPVQYEMFGSSEPCAMCLGGIMWSGVTRLVCAATDIDIRGLLYDTGPVFEQSFTYLRGKGIELKRKFLRAEAKQVVQDYAKLLTPTVQHGRQV